MKGGCVFCTSSVCLLRLLWSGTASAVPHWLSIARGRTCCTLQTLHHVDMYSASDCLRCRWLIGSFLGDAGLVLSSLCDTLFRPIPASARAMAFKVSTGSASTYATLCRLFVLVLTQPPCAHSPTGRLDQGLQVPVCSAT